MNIAFVNSIRRWGGVKTWMLVFAEALVKRGHTVRFYGRDQAFVAAAATRVGYGERAFFGPDCNPWSVGWFYYQFKKHKIDCLIINTGKDLATAGLAARLAGIPVVQRIGLPDDIPYRYKTRALHKFIDPWFLSPCRFIQEGFIRLLPYVQPEKNHMVLNGRPFAPSIPMLAHHPRVLVATQRLSPEKGHETLLRAIAQ